MSELSGRVLEELLDELAERVASRIGPAAPVAAPEWRLLSLDEAAARLGRSSRWVRDRVKAGKLATVRLDGGALAFRLEDLQTFADARRIGGEP